MPLNKEPKPNHEFAIARLSRDDCLKGGETLSFFPENFRTQRSVKKAMLTFIWYIKILSRRIFLKKLPL